MHHQIDSRVQQLAVAFLTAVFLTASGPCVARAQEKEKLLFVSQQPSGAFNVSLMNVDGTGQMNLTKSKAIEADPVWSPDRKKIAFVVFDRKQATADVWVMNADGTERVQLTRNEPKARAGAPCWSPDGKKIVYDTLRARRGEVTIVGADGKGRIALGEGHLPAWSPDGKNILYMRAEEGKPNEVRLYLMDTDGKNIRRLTTTKSGAGVWAPDGKRIAFAGETEAGRGIFVMKADGSEVKLVRKQDGTAGELCPQWSRDGTRLFFTSVQLTNPVTSAIAVIDADGGNAKLLTERKGINFLGGGTSRFVPITVSRKEQP